MIDETNPQRTRRRRTVAKQFEVGDHVRWNSEAGHVSGVIVKKHTRDTEYKGHKRHCTKDDPQYEIRSDKTDHSIAQGRRPGEDRLGHAATPP